MVSLGARKRHWRCQWPDGQEGGQNKANEYGYAGTYGSLCSMIATQFVPYSFAKSLVIRMYSTAQSQGRPIRQTSISSRFRERWSYWTSYQAVWKKKARAYWFLVRWAESWISSKTIAYSGDTVRSSFASFSDLIIYQEYCRIDGSTAHEDRICAIDEYTSQEARGLFSCS